jgi:hypothetical protein
MNKANLQGQGVLLSDIPSEIDDSLHALHLAFYHLVEVFLLDVGEHEEVDGSCVWNRRILRDIFTQSLVEILCQERSVRGLSKKPQYKQTWYFPAEHAP